MKSCPACGSGQLMPKFRAEAGSAPVRYYCSACGHGVAPVEAEEPAYCPDCGKKLAEDIDGTAIFTCRHCKRRHRIHRY